MRKIRVIIVSTPALSRLIQSIFSSHPKFEVVARLAGSRGLSRQADRLLPELIVVSVKPVKTRLCSVILATKRASPLAKLVLICPLSDLIDSALRCGADACLAAENLVCRLVTTASAVSIRQESNPQNKGKPGGWRHQPQAKQHRRSS
jgi:chemotaxis response regulator CheB